MTYTYNELQAMTIRNQWLNKHMTCGYNNERRAGYIRSVKQGPAISNSRGEFTYLNEPDGKVYVDFHHDDGKVRCFLWVKVVNPRLLIDRADSIKAALQGQARIVRAMAQEASVPLAELSLRRRMPRLID